MAYVDDLACCGVGEITHLSSGGQGKEELCRILEEAKEANKGFLIAYFVKLRGEKEFDAQRLMNTLLSHGFKKSSRKFVNPNTGNTIQPLHYMMKKSERAKVPPRETEQDFW